MAVKSLPLTPFLPLEWKIQSSQLRALYFYIIILKYKQTIGTEFMRIFVLYLLTIGITFSLNTYDLNLELSSLEWVGSKITGEHNGTINFSSGYVALDNRTIKEGSFDVNMQSIKNIDIKDPTYRGYLEDHLNDDDFFSTDSFPSATLKIINQFSPDSMTLSLGYNSVIRCELTIKGISNIIDIPAKIEIYNNHATANGSVDIDRTLYDIKYKSKSFFPDIGDKFIYDNFTLTFSLYADRKWEK